MQRSHRVLGVACLGLLALAGWPGTARADTIVLGSDYLETEPGSHFLVGPLGQVPFIGLPFGPGTTDTIVQRKADATIGGGPVPIQIVALSLVSAAPVTIGGFNYRLTAKLDPANLANDVGTITISGSGAGGTFAANLTVFGEVDFTPLNGGPTIPTALTMKVFNSTANWTSTPASNAVLVAGLVGNQNANLHTNLAAGQHDFYVISPVQEMANDLSLHIVDPAVTVPEPSSIALLLAAGLTGAIGWGRRRLFRQVGLSR
jgi:hypothetical protein